MPETVMVARALRLIALAGFWMLGLQSPSHAQAMAAKPATPIRMDSVTINELGTELLVRFDRPISHEQSSLSLIHAGKIVSTLHPRLQAQPNVLFVRIPTPAAGHYHVRWTVCPEGGNDRYDGEFSFTINDVIRKEHHG
jgi:methionine-rich copper-binding protein CopC